MRKLLLIMTALLPLFLAAVALAAWQNLKVLPQDISEPDLKAAMTRMSTELGVSCSHCHVSDEDFAGDTDTKTVARGMLKMTVGLNRDFFGYENAPLVSCFTCHRGSAKPPLPAPPEEPMGPPAPEEPAEVPAAPAP